MTQKKITISFLSIALVLIAGLSFTILDFSAKLLLEEDYHLFFIIWVRYLIHFILLLIVVPMVSNYKKVVFSSHPFLQVLRSLSLLLTTLFNFYALKFLPLSLNSAIFYSAPIFVTIMSILFLKENIGLKRSIAIMIGFLGILLVIQPSKDGFQIEIIWTFFSVICLSFYQILSRKISFNDSNLTSIFYLGVIATIAITPFIYSYITLPQNSYHIFLFLLCGSFGALGHGCLICALSKMPAPIVTSLSYTTIIFMAFFDYLIWNNILNATALMGIFIVIASGLFIIWRSNRNNI